MGLVETKKTIMEKPVLWIGVAIVALSLITLGVVVFLKMNSGTSDDVLAIVGGEKIYQKDLNEQIYGLDFEGTPDNPPEISNEEKNLLLQDLVAAKIAEKELNETSSQVTEDEINETIKQRLGDVIEDYTGYQERLVKKVVTNELMINKAKAKNVGWKAGQFLVCRFDYPYEFGLDINADESMQRVEKDKEYAKNLCTTIYNDVTAGKLSFVDAMKKLDNDPQIGLSVWGKTYALAEAFTKQDFEDETSFDTTFWDNVLKAKKGTLYMSDVIKVKNDKDENYHDGFYALVDINDEGPGQYRTYTKWLEAMKIKYKVEYKVSY
ncbi:hypothetical protein HGB13_01345 [bacterium]|nr:hypothetical protein [bacterium]